ncbi:MAG: flavodoxin-dependent (E)-4-hydroxy-3-methylbut-2-enyl-diphosphate synthase [Candidatus Omnitrophica bacterium]|nr:flavodoxin-dependent (E)-4-hydroxy-3-methylbut-2-enyl-diphosphate synthase [Candidatus Omnitrophota bacterium]
MNRDIKKVIRVGNVAIGGRNPIVIQSMAKVKTSDTGRVLKQISELENAGCQIVRLAIKDMDDARLFRKIKRQSSLPLVADIHFDYRLALAAIDSGADKIRLNPGNIYKKKEIKEVVSALRLANIPLRIGLNSGSVRGSNLKNISMPDKLVRSALSYIKIVESFKFRDIIISLKASSVLDTVLAYRKMAKLSGYPLHLGVTATGPAYAGMIKSSIALGALLLEGIGDTIRVSLAAKPVQEVYAARSILESLNLRSFGPEIISCPTCGRCEVDLISIVKKLEKELSGYSVSQLSCFAGKRLKVALMGCVVNGPGEAKEADLGVAFGKKEGLLFKNGKAVKKISFSDSINVLLKEMENKNG